MRWRRRPGSEPADDDLDGEAPVELESADDADVDGGTPAEPEPSDDAAPAPTDPGTVERHDLDLDAEEAEAAHRQLPPPVYFHVDPVDVQRAMARAVARALAEDLGIAGDVTSQATVPPGTQGGGDIIAREEGTVAGTAAIVEAFAQVDGRVSVDLLVTDGTTVAAGDVIARVEGPLRSILTAERTALNLVSHLSGVATATRRCVDVLEGTGCEVRDTRKTTPGLRLLEKAAVVAGGGTNHRAGLHDALLVKDNHVVAAGGVTEATTAALARANELPVQVEVTSLAELADALAAGATDILLDNFDPALARRAVELTRGYARLEASGRIDPGSARAFAEAGVDRVSVGSITHSAPALDIALDLSAAEVDVEPQAADVWTDEEPPGGDGESG